jgi:hypothetical protein
MPVAQQAHPRQQQQQQAGQMHQEVLALLIALAVVVLVLAKPQTTKVWTMSWLKTQVWSLPQLWYLY